MLLNENNITSFNENEVINFEPIKHVYTHLKTLKVLTGATTHIKRYIKSFDEEQVAIYCSKNWSLDADYIKKSWSQNGYVASVFGTAIHAALEFEDNCRHYYKKNGERCFQIKHPMIRKIVDEFYTYAKTLNLKGKSYPEALISDVENGFCALVDKLIVTNTAKKECILCDYKINYDYEVLGKEEFINIPSSLDLPTNKLSKLALQLRFQEQILQNSGWSVIRKIAFVYELEWTHYEVPDIKNFDVFTGKINN